MTFRSDISINWEQSPRLITVEAPSTALTIQDMHDTLAALEDSIEGSEHPNLISSAGKNVLGGGLFVGITSTLQNAQIRFAARFALVTSGTVTTQNTAGVTCICAAETYISDGVTRGDVVHNHLDGSHATVLTVDSEIQLTTTPLEGGSDNNYDIGDDIGVSQVEGCTISGGNLVAVDSVGDPLDPVFPTYGTSVTIESSTSASLNNVSTGFWTDNLTEDYPVDGQSATTPAQMLYSINQMLSEFARTGTTVSIKKRDGTEAFQLTLDSATAPTTSTQSS